jgi:putative FmdB family regulatory protein
MPIYEYRCSACGFQNDFLQKVTEPPLTDCPECGRSTFAKQVTAAGFQLKGTGWYATDFKNKGKGKGKGGEESKGDTKAAEAAETGSASKDESASKDGAAACGAGACPACT